MELRFFSTAELEYLLRIVLAAACGGAIGFERERRFKSAGIRTHLIVALSSALMVVISKYGFYDVAGSAAGFNLDVSRVAAGVVSAIGFLGAGVIFFRKDTVSGVTTAAGLWATVGVGIAVGAGLYFTGVAVTALIVLLQIMLHRRTPLVKPQKLGAAVLRIRDTGGSGAAALRRLETLFQHIGSMELLRLGGGELEIRCEVLFPPEYTAADLLRILEETPELLSVEMHLP